MTKKKTDENVERFIGMYLSGMKMVDIAKDLGVCSRQTLYDWLNDENIKAEMDKRRQEIKDAGSEFLKSNYLQYIKNINELANQKEDKRTALAANQFMIEKLDGKNTAKLEINDPDDKDKITPEQLENEFSKFKDKNKGE